MNACHEINLKTDANKPVDEFENIYIKNNSLRVSSNLA